MSSSRTFRVFISSTFSDLVEERNALQRKVWPELKSRCEKAGFHFQAIDLRWGISEEAGFDQRTSRICLSELQRCQEISPRPNFVILSGSRYGWRPLPDQIGVDEFGAIEAAIGEPGCSLLKEWYRRDDNAIPAVYWLRPRRKDIPEEAAFAVWSERVERPLRQLLLQSAERIGLAEDLRRREFETSLTEREILAGALRENAKEHVFAYFRDVEAFDPMEALAEAEADCLGRYLDCVDRTTRDLTARDLQRSLKSRIETALPPDHVRKYAATWNGDSVSQDHLDALCDDVLRDLWSIIEVEIASAVRSDPLEMEIEAHRQFGELRGAKEHFTGQSPALARIASYLEDATIDSPLVVSGHAGTGKTALMARAAGDAGLPSDRVVLQRFIGATPDSVHIGTLLAGILEELNRRQGRSARTPADYQEIVRALHECLRSSSSEQPLCLFLDGVDQLSDEENARQLAWLPASLPRHVKLVVSVLRTSDAVTGSVDTIPAGPSEPFEILRRRSSDGRLLLLDDFPRDDAQALLNHLLELEGRRLTSVQTALALKAIEACPRPLFVKLLAEEAKEWRADEPTPQLPAGETHESVLTAIIGRLFDRLAEPTNHGKLLVERAISYLVASKNGLTEDELIGLLSTDSEFFGAFQEQARQVGQPLPSGTASLPTAVWVRLNSDLRPYLIHRNWNGASLISFFHRSVEQAARARFLETSDITIQRREHIVSYFQPDDRREFFRLSPDEQRAWAREKPGQTRPVSLRRLSELPYQLLALARCRSLEDPDPAHWSDVSDLLIAIHFLEAKAESGTLFSDLLDELALVCRFRPAGGVLGRLLATLHASLRSSAGFLREHPTALYQCLLNQSPRDDDDLARHAFRPFDASETNALRRMRLMTQPLAPVQSSDWQQRVGTLCNSFSQLLNVWWHDKASTQGSLHWLRSLRPDDTHTNASATAVVRAHSGGVECLALTSDFAKIVSAAKDGTIRVTDRLTQSELLCIPHPRDRIASIALFGDDERLAVASWDGNGCRVYDLVTGALQFSVATAPALPLSVAVSPDQTHIAVGCDDGVIRIIDVAVRQVVQALRGHTGSVMALAFTAGGDRLLSTAKEAKSIRVWSTKSWTTRKIITPGSVGRPYTNWEAECVACSADGRSFVTGHVDGSVRIWESKKFQILHLLDGLTWPVLSVAFSGDGTRVIASGHQGECAVWDVETRSIVGQPTGQAGDIWATRLSKDGSLCAIACEDATIRVISLVHTGPASFENHHGAVTAICPLPREDQFVTTGFDGIVRVWNSHGVLVSRHLASNAIYSACADPARRLVYLYTSSGTLEVLDLETGEFVFQWIVNMLSTPAVVAISPVRGVLSLVSAHQVRTFELSNSGRHPVETRNGVGSQWGDLENATLKQLSDPLATAACFSEDGGRLACGYTTGAVRVWDLDDSWNERRLTGLSSGVVDLAWGDCGGEAVIATSEHETACWNLETPDDAARSAVIGDPQQWPQYLQRDGRHLVASRRHVRVEVQGGAVVWHPGMLRRIRKFGDMDRWIVSDGTSINVLAYTAVEATRVVHDDDATVVRVGSDGVVVAYRHPLLGDRTDAFRAYVRAAISDAMITHLILDFTQIQTASSVALAGLHGLARTLKSREGRLTIVGLNSFFEQVFRWCSLDEVFSVQRTICDAMNGERASVMQPRTRLEKALSRVSGGARNARQAVMDGHGAKAVRDVEEMLEVTVSELGSNSVEAGVCCRLVGQICQLSEEWDQAEHYFSVGAKILSRFIGEGHSLVLDCEKGVVACGARKDAN
jgi:anti-anti-sigma factor